MNVTNILIIASIVIYFFLTLSYFVRQSNKNKALDIVSKKEVMLFFWEKSIINKMGIRKNAIKPIVYISRALILIIFIAISYTIGAIALTLVCSITIVMTMERKSSSLVHEAGINHLGSLNAFLDSYIPSIASGLSNDQAMLKYINSINSEDLFEWWANKESDTYVPKVEWRRIIEVYNIVKYNEDRGIDNSLPIIEQMQKDLNVKQEYYNDYTAKMGEVQPIVLSYYIFVPVLLFISFRETSEFWFSIWGYIASIGLVILLAGSQFIIYKIRESTIKTMF